MRPITDDQRNRLEDIEKKVRIQFERMWGLLSPSRERDTIMQLLQRAEYEIRELRTQSRQMTMDDLEKESPLAIRINKEFTPEEIEKIKKEFNNYTGKVVAVDDLSQVEVIRHDSKTDNKTE